MRQKIAKEKSTQRKRAKKLKNSRASAHAFPLPPVHSIYSLRMQTERARTDFCLLRERESEKNCSEYAFWWYETEHRQGIFDSDWSYFFLKKKKVLPSKWIKYSMWRKQHIHKQYIIKQLIARTRWGNWVLRVDMYVGFSFNMDEKWRANGKSGLVLAGGGKRVKGASALVLVPASRKQIKSICRLTCVYKRLKAKYKTPKNNSKKWKVKRR